MKYSVDDTCSGNRTSDTANAHLSFKGQVLAHYEGSTLNGISVQAVRLPRIRTGHKRIKMTPAVFQTDKRKRD